jgi:uncharacterized membrane protein YccC
MISLPVIYGQALVEATPWWCVAPTCVAEVPLSVPGRVVTDRLQALRKGHLILVDECDAAGLRYARLTAPAVGVAPGKERATSRTALRRRVKAPQLYATRHERVDERHTRRTCPYRVAIEAAEVIPAEVCVNERR